MPQAKGKTAKGTSIESNRRSLTHSDRNQAGHAFSSIILTNRQPRPITNGPTSFHRLRRTPHRSVNYIHMSPTFRSQIKRQRPQGRFTRFRGRLHFNRTHINIRVPNTPRQVHGSRRHSLDANASPRGSSVARRVQHTVNKRHNQKVAHHRRSRTLFMDSDDRTYILSTTTQPSHLRLQNE